MSNTSIFDRVPPAPPPCEVCGEPSQIAAMTIVEAEIVKTKDSGHFQNYAVHGPNRFFCYKHKPHFSLFPIKELYPGYKTSQEFVDESYINAV